MGERGRPGPAPGCWPWMFAAAGVPVCAAASESLMAAVISGESGVRPRRCWVPGFAAPSSSSCGGVNESDIMIAVYLWLCSWTLKVQRREFADAYERI